MFLHSNGNAKIIDSVMYQLMDELINELLNGQITNDGLLTGKLSMY